MARSVILFRRIVNNALTEQAERQKAEMTMHADLRKSAIRFWPALQYCEERGVPWCGFRDCSGTRGNQGKSIMRATRTVVAFLLCLSVWHASVSANAQDVKTTSDKSVDFSKYNKYTWGQNYLLTQQTKDVQERINKAIVDSINRNLQADGFVEDDKNPDFIVTYEAGGQPKADVGAQRYLYAADMQNYYWGGELTGITTDVWVSSLAKMKITVADAATKRELWQATASMKIRDRTKFANNLHENVDNFIQKTMRNFPPKK